MPSADGGAVAAGGKIGRLVAASNFGEALMNGNISSAAAAMTSFATSYGASSFVDYLDDTGAISNASYKTLGMLQTIWSEGMGEGIGKTSKNVDKK